MTNSSPRSSSTGPSAKVSRRIFGPCRSARTPMARPVSLDAARTRSYRAWCSAWEPWLKLKRATFIPASIMETSISWESTAGPRVQTIFERRMGRSYRFVSLRNIPSGGKYKWAAMRSAVLLPCICSAVVSHQCVGLCRDLQFLVGRHDGDGHTRGRGRDQPRPIVAHGVQFAVHRQAQLLQARDGSLPHRARVFPDSRCEGDRVDPSEHRVIGADVLLQAVN